MESDWSMTSDDKDKQGRECDEKADGPGFSIEEDSECLQENSYINIANVETDCSWQSHLHEYIGSTNLAKEGGEKHNHRFAGITGEAIYVPGSHVHRLVTNTDFYDHFHELHVISGPATFLLDRDAKKSDRKHVHFAEGSTSQIGHHCHKFAFATIIEAPLLGEDKKDRD